MKAKRQDKRNAGETLPPMGMKTTQTRFGERWRKSFGHITHLKTNVRGEWVHKDVDTGKRSAGDDKYSRYE